MQFGEIDKMQDFAKQHIIFPLYYIKSDNNTITSKHQDFVVTHKSTVARTFMCNMVSEKG